MMKFQLACLVAVASVTLVACDSADAPTSPVAAVVPAATVGTPATASAIGLSSEGLRIGGAMLAFGAPRAEVETAIKTALGSDPVVSANGDCPTGATADLSWGETLQVITRDDVFIGWDTSADGPRTPSGVHVGSTRAQAEAGKDFSIPETPFDMVEIAVDGVGGFLTSGGADGTVTQMFAGDTCMAR